MMVVLTVLGVLLVALWCALVLGVGAWGRGFELERRSLGIRRRVSLCIPARNEKGNVGAAVRSALAQEGVDVEVIVVDDESTDGTFEEAVAAGEGDQRLRVLHAEPRPEGWSGKAWALRCAEQNATAPWLLFVDADVRLHHDAVAALASAGEGSAGLSAFGSWELVSFWERALVPAIGWFIRGSVDLGRIHDPSRPDAFANGQVILVAREVYDAVGGHGAVRASVLDDVDLARVLKASGHGLALRFAPWAFRVRLYRSLAEIRQGYRKNLYAGMGFDRRVGAVAIAFVGLAGALPLPLGILLLALGRPLEAAPFALVVFLQILFRFRVERKDGRSGAYAWTHPIANVLLLVILLESVLGRQAQWKGRTFTAGRAT